MLNFWPQYDQHIKVLPQAQKCLFRAEPAARKHFDRIAKVIAKPLVCCSRSQTRGTRVRSLSLPCVTPPEASGATHSKKGQDNGQHAIQAPPLQDETRHMTGFGRSRTETDHQMWPAFADSGPMGSGHAVDQELPPSERFKLQRVRHL